MNRGFYSLEIYYRPHIINIEWNQCDATVLKNWRHNDYMCAKKGQSVALFTNILTIDFDLERKRAILFLFTKTLTSIFACKICCMSTIVLTLS